MLRKKTNDRSLLRRGDARLKIYTIISVGRLTPATTEALGRFEGASVRRPAPQSIAGAPSATTGYCAKQRALPTTDANGYTINVRMSTPHQMFVHWSEVYSLKIGMPRVRI